MRISDWSSDVCSSDLHNVFVLYIQTRGSKSQKHYAEKFSALGEDILQILISDRDAVVRGVTKEDAFALIDEFSKRYDAERSEERREGKASVSPCRSWWSPFH